MLSDAESLAERWRDAPAEVVAGDALTAFAGRLETGAARASARGAAPAPPRSLALAAAAWRDGAGVDAAAGLAALRARQGRRDDARARGARPMSADAFASPSPSARRRRAASPADDRERARRASCALEAAGLSLPLDPRQLRRFAGRRLRRLDAERRRRRAASATASRCPASRRCTCSTSRSRRRRAATATRAACSPSWSRCAARRGRAALWLEVRESNDEARAHVPAPRLRARSACARATTRRPRASARTRS